MYGCYVGITQDGHTGVLVLQYCGVPLTVELKYYSGNVRFQAVNALLAIHKAGVQHNDFVERNLVVVKDVDGDPYVRVVDFGRSCEHTCPEELDVIKLYDRAPWKGSFKCYELYDVCTGAEVWTDRCAIYFYRPIPIEYATSVDSILAYAGFPPGESESNARKVAQEAINDINLWWRRRKARDANPASIDLEDNDSNNNTNNADDNDNHDNNLNHSDDDGDAE
ncbi:hypothetical protein L227DRAFT_656900 [Lentinus tigrinus ALCF2SS1-6]|uniref:Protein kinase domain-containing protein n=1 Tax=Lentinus tigrinus ALCF2SS1-6 TaxID=1328759 RepID=A0A5C2RWW4_9APHY|nr:hypothetical protein L227DRAFT_656900 [Lentinus tigrinus ALCF2SS1-6]